MNGKVPLARFTFHIDADMGERLKNAAGGLGLSVAKFLVRAAVQATVDAEQQHNDGEPFRPQPVLTPDLPGHPHTEGQVAMRKRQRPIACQDPAVFDAYYATVAPDRLVRVQQLAVRAALRLPLFEPRPDGVLWGEVVKAEELAPARSRRPRKAS